MNDHNHLKSLINNNDGIFPVKKTNDRYIFKIYIYFKKKELCFRLLEQYQNGNAASVKCGKQTDQNYVHIRAMLKSIMLVYKLHTF